jgi:hypothetical protein
MHLMALPAFLVLTGCFGIPAATEPPAAAVAPASSVAVRTCTESGADAKDPRAREAVCLKELGEQANRKGRVLSLKIEDGPAKTFRGKSGGCKEGHLENCIAHYLVGFYPTYATAGAYLVMSLSEGTSYDLVNARTGGMKDVGGVPRLAPDNSTFFVKACGDGCTISIETMTAATHVLSNEVDSPGNASDWDFVRWIDNDQVALRSAKENERCPRANCEAILKRTRGAWTMERLPPKSDAM